MTADTSNKGQAPRYRLTERAYLDDHLYEAGAEITWLLPPAHYMQPLNATAKKAVEQHRPVKTDPINTLTIIAPSTAAPAA